MGTRAITRPERQAPGPRGLPLLGNLDVFRSPDPLAEMTALQRQYGNLVRLTFGPRVVHLLFGAGEFKHVLQDNNRNYIKGRTFDKTKPLLGEGLLTSEGEFWRRQRRLIQPMFNRQRIGSFLPVMVAVVEEMLGRWRRFPPGEVVDISREMARLTLEIISRVMFSTGLTPDEADTVSQVMPELMRETNRRISSLTGLRERLPLPGVIRYRRSIQALEQILYRLIEERRRSGEDHPDLLGMLLAAREAGQAAMSDRQIRDELMTIFLAGHETTAALMDWTLVLLSRHPESRRRLQVEVDRVLGGRTPDLADLEQLTYTFNVLQESLRLYPPAWALARQAIGQDEIDGYTIPAGSGMVLVPLVAHHSPEYWDNPEGFDPDRFEPDRSAGRPAYAFIPFGGGPRLCLGNNFALQEATIALAMIAQQAELDLAPGCPVTAMNDFTLRPAQGIWMRLRWRAL